MTEDSPQSDDAGEDQAAVGGERGRHRSRSLQSGDRRQILASALAGIAAGLEVNAISNHIGDWAALAVVAVLTAAAWLRKYPPTSRLRTTAAGTAIVLAGLNLLVAGFAPYALQLPAILIGVLLTTLATLLPTDPKEAVATLFGVAALGAGSRTSDSALTY